MVAQKDVILKTTTGHTVTIKAYDDDGMVAQMRSEAHLHALNLAALPHQTPIIQSSHIKSPNLSRQWPTSGIARASPVFNNYINAYIAQFFDLVLLKQDICIVPLSEPNQPLKLSLAIYKKANSSGSPSENTGSGNATWLTAYELDHLCYLKDVQCRKLNGFVNGDMQRIHDVKSAQETLLSLLFPKYSVGTNSLGRIRLIPLILKEVFASEVDNSKLTMGTTIMKHTEAYAPHSPFVGLLASHMSLSCEDSTLKPLVSLIAQSPAAASYAMAMYLHIITLPLHTLAASRHVIEGLFPEPDMPSSKLDTNSRRRRRLRKQLREAVQKPIDDQSMPMRRSTVQILNILARWFVNLATKANSLGGELNSLHNLITKDIVEMQLPGSTLALSNTLYGIVSDSKLHSSDSLLDRYNKCNQAIQKQVLISACRHIKIECMNCEPVTAKASAIIWAVPPGTYRVRVPDNFDRSTRNIFLRLFPSPAKADVPHYNIKSIDLIHKSRLLLKNLKKEATAMQLDEHTADELHKFLRTLVSVTSLVLRFVPIGTADQRLSAALINSSSHSDASKYVSNILTTNMYCALNSTVSRRLKCVSIMLRRCSWLINHGPVDSGTVARLSYLELTDGRSNHTSNWVEERQNRVYTTTPLGIPEEVSMKFYSESDQLNRNHTQAEKRHFNTLLREKIRGIITKLLAGYQVTETLEQFYLRRHEWMSSGSASGCSVGRLVGDEVLHQLPPDVPSVRVNKRVWADHTPYKTIAAALKGKPVERASASEKFENGKARALYGVEPIHYVINTYATKGLESRLQRVQGLEKGSDAFATYFNERRRANITAEDTNECTMFDYADFNRQHTPLAQAMIFEEMAKMGEHMGLPQDWIDSNLWIAKSKFNMRCSFGPSLPEEKVVQGMFSGTRSTDYINTILNLAYFQVASSVVAQRYGILPTSLYNVHQGDDVWVSNTNKLWSRLMYYTLNQMGLVFQESKQMFGPGRGEYLRILYINGESLGYTQRALVNFLLRPVQNDEIRDLRALAAMNADSMQLFYRRGLGMPACSFLWHVLYQKYYIVRSHVTDRKPYRLPVAAVVGDVWSGGLSNPVPGTFSMGQCGRLDIPALTWSNQRIRILQGQMAHDWIQHMSPKLHQYGVQSINAEAVVEAAFNSNYIELARQIADVADMKKYKKDIAAAMQGTYRTRTYSVASYEEVLPLVESYASYGTELSISDYDPNTVKLAMICNVKDDLTVDVPSSTAAPTLANNIARFENANVFKSLNVAKQALGLNTRDTLLALAHIDTTFMVSNEDVASLVIARAQYASDIALEYLVGRQVGLASILGNFTSQTFVSLVHQAIVSRLVRSNQFAKVVHTDRVVHYDAQSLYAVLCSMGHEVSQAKLLAY